MKILCLCAFWQRPEITKLFVNGFVKLQQSIDYDLELLCILSKEDQYFKENLRILTGYGFNVCEYQNKPLGEKMNAGIKYALGNFEFDYLMNLGSDNIINPKLFDIYKPYFNKGSLFFGIESVYFYCNNSKLLYLFNIADGFIAMGAGRMIHKDILDKMDSNNIWLYNHDINASLDTNSTINIVLNTKIKPEIIKTGEIAYVLDIKSETNIHTIDEIIQYSKLITDKTILHEFGLY